MNYHNNVNASFGGGNSNMNIRDFLAEINDLATNCAKLNVAFIYDGMHYKVDTCLFCFPAYFGNSKRNNAARLMIPFDDKETYTLFSQGQEVSLDFEIVGNINDTSIYSKGTISNLIVIENPMVATEPNTWNEDVDAIFSPDVCVVTFADTTG